MKHSRLVPVLVACCLLGAALLTIGSPSLSAAEPAREFLQGLRSRGYFDTAQDYLERIATSPITPPEFRETVAYEQGLTLIQQARMENDTASRDRALEAAREQFDSFLKANPDHLLASKAASQLGNVLVERARVKVYDAKKPSNAGRKAELMKEASAAFDVAEKVFVDSLETLRQKLANIPKVIDPNDKALVALRDQLRTDYVQAQLVIATILYEKSETAANTTERDAILDKAAAQYGEVYEKYRRRLAGLYARLYQGRCHQDKGDYKEALSYYTELLAQPEEPDVFRDLKTKTLKMAIQCWNDDSQKKYDLSVNKGSVWVKKIRPNEQTNSDWLELQYLVAVAEKKKADTLNEKDPTRKPMLEEAKALATAVSKVPGDFKNAATALLADLGAKVSPEGKPDPKNFGEAFAAGKGSLEKMQSSQSVIRLLGPKIKIAAEGERKTEMQTQLDEAKKGIEDARFDAISYFQLSLKFADSETDMNELNSARYYLCYLSYVMGDYYDAAVMGEFVARAAPDSPGGSQCAKIAMASYLKLYQEEKEFSPGDPLTFETNRIVGISDYISKQWPGQPDADDALSTLINFMIQLKRFDDAEQYLAEIGEDSAKRGDAELKVGQALWSNYLNGMAEIREQLAADPPLAQVVADQKTTELNVKKEKAQETLRKGVERMRQGEPTQSVALAVLSLSQIYVDANQPLEAIGLLEDPNIGPRTLVDKKDPLVDREGYSEETYKTCLRAYIGALTAADDATAMMDKAQAVMDALSATVGDDEEGRKRLISIYISLARDLQRTIELASSDDKQTLSAGFEKFLDRVSAGTTEFNVLAWVAETYFGMGRGFDTGTGVLNPKARQYYDKSRAAYQKILDLAGKDPNVTDQVVLQVRMQMAKVGSRMGEYEKALKTFDTVLKENAMLLNVQIEAAETYQKWAGDGGDPEDYQTAIRGAGDKDKKTQAHTIWGWGRLAKVTARQMLQGPEQKAKYNDTFHNSRYNLAMCNYLYAMKQAKGSDKRNKYMKYARDDVIITGRQFPDWGGDSWKRKYDDLLKRIQPQLGEKAQGIDVLSATAAKPAGS